MKHLYSLLLLFVITSCTQDQSDFETQNDIKFHIASEQFVTKSGSFLGEPCKSTDLIAGQNIVAGTVDVYLDGSNISIVYTTNGGWSMEETHMSIGNCTGDIPTTGSGNPKVGHFEYSANHSAGTTVVTYTTDASTLPLETCFAAHAVVTNNSGQNETAWGAGIGFPGRSWATYVELDMSSCTANDRDPRDPGTDR